MNWFAGGSYAIVKKIFAKQIAADAELSDKDSVSDIFGAKVTAVQLMTYPPATTGVLILEPKDIVTRHDNVLKKLRRYSQLPARQHDKGIPTFETLYYDVIINFINFVHLVPASESHHHTDVGGLVRHSLQVAEKALKHVDQEILERKFPLDIERDRKSRWHYATFLCGLLHDASKVFTDMKVVDMESGIIWNPDEFGLVDWARENNVRRYRVEYINGRNHMEHDSIKGSNVLDYILTKAAKSFLLQCPDNIHAEMRKTLVSYQSINGYISNAVRAADAASTSKDMITVWDNELGPKTASLYERIIKAMRILSKQWDCNMHNSRVQIAGSRVYLRYPEAFNDVVKFLSDEGVSAPAGSDAIIDILDARNLIYRPDKLAKYAMIANGNYSINDIIDSIKGESSHKSGMYIPVAWPAMLYNKDPVPPSTPCYVKFNTGHDYEVFNLDGSVHVYGMEDFCAIDESVRSLSIKKKKDADIKKNSGGQIPVDKSVIDSMTSKGKEKDDKNGKPKTQTKPKAGPLNLNSSPMNTNKNTNKSGPGNKAASVEPAVKNSPVNHEPKIEMQDILLAQSAEQADNKELDDIAESSTKGTRVVKTASLKSKKTLPTSLPWTDGRKEDPSDRLIANIVSEFQQGKLSQDDKQKFHHYKQGLVAINANYIKACANETGLITYSEFLDKCTSLGLVSHPPGGKKPIRKLKINEDVRDNVIVFRYAISKYIIEETGLPISNHLTALAGE